MQNSTGRRVTMESLQTLFPLPNHKPTPYIVINIHNNVLPPGDLQHPQTQLQQSTTQQTGSAVVVNNTITQTCTNSNNITVNNTQHSDNSRHYVTHVNQNNSPGSVSNVNSNGNNSNTGEKQTNAQGICRIL